VLYDPGNANWDGYLRALQGAERPLMVSVSPAPVNVSSAASASGIGHGR
jgi:hypothetical protein